MKIFSSTSFFRNHASKRSPGAGGELTPSLSLGLHHDSGDAETGSDMELGAGLSYANPSRGLDMALRMQGLAAHAADDYGAWCVS